MEIHFFSHLHNNSDKNSSYCFIIYLQRGSFFIIISLHTRVCWIFFIRMIVVVVFTCIWHKICVIMGTQHENVIERASWQRRVKMILFIHKRVSDRATMLFSRTNKKLMHESENLLPSLRCNNYFQVHFIHAKGVASDFFLTRAASVTFCEWERVIYLKASTAFCGKCTREFVIEKTWKSSGSWLKVMIQNCNNFIMF